MVDGINVKVWDVCLVPVRLLRLVANMENGCVGNLRMLAVRKGKMFSEKGWSVCL